MHKPCGLIQSSSVNGDWKTGEADLSEQENSIIGRWRYSLTESGSILYRVCDWVCAVCIHGMTTQKCSGPNCSIPAFRLLPAPQNQAIDLEGVKTNYARSTTQMDTEEGRKEHVEGFTAVKGRWMWTPPVIFTEIKHQNQEESKGEFTPTSIHQKILQLFAIHDSPKSRRANHASLLVEHFRPKSLKTTNSFRCTSLLLDVEIPVSFPGGQEQVRSLLSRKNHRMA